MKFIDTGLEITQSCRLVQRIQRELVDPFKILDAFFQLGFFAAGFSIFSHRVARMPPAGTSQFTLLITLLAVMQDLILNKFVSFVKWKLR